MGERKHIREAQSKNNGIVFYSNIFPLIGSETFRDDLGNIQTRVIPVHLIDYSGIVNENEKPFNKWDVIILDIFLINICILIGNISLILASIYFSIFVSFDFFIFIKISYQIKSKNGKQRSAARYHAAEHMVINSYENLQRIPTSDEVKSSSRFSKCCGSRKILFKISIYTLESLIIAFGFTSNIIIYILLNIFIIVFIIIADMKGWLRFLQVFITTIPSDSEIEVAIEGIKNFEKMEEEFKNKSKISMSITIIPQDFT